ncbi:MAG TPA: PfkB family carbohydrate kinase, partial [Solirubrobacter sp.]|nr:PfkB family carbohydrate kinase [Solirubrobacter sp.]
PAHTAAAPPHSPPTRAAAPPHSPPADAAATAPHSPPTHAAATAAHSSPTHTAAPPHSPPTDAAGAPPGVVLLGHEVGEGVVLAAARAAADAGWPVVLNPAPARELPDVPFAVVTPNAAEAAQLTGHDDPEAAARELVARTGAAALVTLGPRGALLLAPGGELTRLPATRVDAVDTTGAGDTVNGALAVELASGHPLADAARFALAAAALSTTAPGARGGMPTRDAVLAALAR